MSSKLLLISILIFSSITILGQTPSPTPPLRVEERPVSGITDEPIPPMPPPPKTPKQITGGVLNGKATSLPKPPYPPAARAVHASGAVSVHVLIDEEGNVVSASATSGHPLLRAAAEAAAREAKFSPTLLAGQPVKVAGTIVYNFVGISSWRAIGSSFGIAEDGLFAGPRLKELAFQLPEGFEFEKQELIDLVDGLAEGGKASDLRGEMSRLIYSIQGKLVSSSVDLWFFDLGLTVQRVIGSTKDHSQLRTNLLKLRELADSSNGKLSDDGISRLAKLCEYAISHEFSEQDVENILALVQKLQ